MANRQRFRRKPSPRTCRAPPVDANSGKLGVISNHMPLILLLAALSAACPQHLSPVCSTENVTYGNYCLLLKAGAVAACAGKCPCLWKCPVPLQNDVVCGVDGRTYGNQCFAARRRVRVACSGTCPCRRLRMRSLEMAPVCGEDGATYLNEDYADGEIRCQGRCPCPEDCPRIHDPVCAENGHTYENVCFARGERVVCRGRCPQKLEA